MSLHVSPSTISFHSVLIFTLCLTAQAVALHLPTRADTNLIIHTMVRTLDSTTVTVQAECKLVWATCSDWCNYNLGQGDSIDQACASDCEDDACSCPNCASVEYDGTEMSFTAFNNLIIASKQQARDAAIAAGLRQLENGGSEEVVNRVYCLQSCKTMADLAGRVGVEIGSDGGGLGALQACLGWCEATYAL